MAYMNQPALRVLVVDEAGDPVLVGSSSNDPYVITGLILDTDDEAEALKLLDELVHKHAGPGELKSSKIKNTRRRLTILKDIQDAGLRHYSLVIDKSLLLRESGLQYKTSTYKFLHRMFYSRLFGRSEVTRTYIDTYGSSQFMKSFGPYLEEQSMMFRAVYFVRAREFPGAQIADVIAGSLRLVEIGEEGGEVENLLRVNGSVVEYWPPRRRPSPMDDLAESPELQSLGIIASVNYVESRANDEDFDVQLRCYFLRYLLSSFTVDPQRYVLREEIVRHLFTHYGVTISSDALSMRVIGPLRSEGLLLVSTNNGVKLPYSAQDYSQWVERVNSQTIPNLRRLSKARNTIKLSTHSALDIVDPVRHDELAAILDALKSQV